MPTMTCAHEANRRLMLRLAALVALCAGIEFFAGIPELVAWLTPLFVLATLLLSGRYIGEEKLLELRARRLRRETPLPRPARVPAAWAPERPLTSLFERTALLLRGPPALAAVTSE